MYCGLVLMWKNWGYRNKNATIAPAFSVEPLLSKDEVDSQYQAGKTCKMVPLQRVALDKKNGEEDIDKLNWYLDKFEMFFGDDINLYELYHSSKQVVDTETDQLNE